MESYVYSHSSSYLQGSPGDFDVQHTATTTTTETVLCESDNQLKVISQDARSSFSDGTHVDIIKSVEVEELGDLFGRSGFVKRDEFHGIDNCGRMPVFVDEINKCIWLHPSEIRLHEDSPVIKRREQFFAISFIWGTGVQCCYIHSSDAADTYMKFRSMSYSTVMFNSVDGGPWKQYRTKGVGAIQRIVKQKDKYLPDPSVTNKPEPGVNDTLLQYMFPSRQKLDLYIKHVDMRCQQYYFYIKALAENVWSRWDQSRKPYYFLQHARMLLRLDMMDTPNPVKLFMSSTPFSKMFQRFWLLTSSKLMELVKKPLGEMAIRTGYGRDSLEIERDGKILFQFAEKIFECIMQSVDFLSFEIRWICRQMKLLLIEKFPGINAHVLIAGAMFQYLFQPSIESYERWYREEIVLHNKDVFEKNLVLLCEVLESSFFNCSTCTGRNSMALFIPRPNNVDTVIEKYIESVIDVRLDSDAFKLDFVELQGKLHLIVVDKNNEAIDGDWTPEKFPGNLKKYATQIDVVNGNMPQDQGRTNRVNSQNQGRTNRVNSQDRKRQSRPRNRSNSSKQMQPARPRNSSNSSKQMPLAISVQEVPRSSSMLCSTSKQKTGRRSRADAATIKAAPLFPLPDVSRQFSSKPLSVLVN